MTKQHLIENNMKLVYHIVNTQFPTYSTDEDIIQAGMVGLCKAADTWDETISKFSTYACKSILNEIQMEFRMRKKHCGVLSLDYEVDNEECKTTFGDLQVGEEDVVYVDDDRFYNLLTEDEKTVFDINKIGFSPDEIAESCGWSVQKVWKILRVVQIKWRNFNGNLS